MEKIEELGGVAPSTFYCRLTAGEKHFTRGGKTAWLLKCRAYTGVLTMDFK
jgi:hypothetical protein